jgi:uncharacterized protein RhaS with RHS repeats
MVALNEQFTLKNPSLGSGNRVGDFFYEVEPGVGNNRLAGRFATKGKSSYSYELASGRSNWLSRDPIAENGGLNLYAYVGNNPVNYWDPNGLAPKSSGDLTVPIGDFDKAGPGLDKAGRIIDKSDKMGSELAKKKPPTPPPSPAARKTSSALRGACRTAASCPTPAGIADYADPNLAVAGAGFAKRADALNKMMDANATGDLSAAADAADAYNGVAEEINRNAGAPSTFWGLFW